MSTIRWAVATAIALVAIAVVLRLLLWVMTPLVPLLIIVLFCAMLFGILIRGR